MYTNVLRIETGYKPSDFIRIESHPRIIIVCGPARSGTTALSHIFIRANIESHMQPIKSNLRALVNDESAPVWQFNGNPERVILSKETLGPRGYELFNPVEMLVSLGYPRERILPILIARDPCQTLASWLDLWDNAIEMGNFVLAYRKIMEIAEYCDAQNIGYISFAHDSIKNNPPNSIIENLLARCGVSARLEDVIDWSGGPKFGPDDHGNPRLFFYDKPPKKFIDGVRNWGGYIYKERPVSQHVLLFVAQHPDITRIYRIFVQKCERDFGIVI